MRLAKQLQALASILRDSGGNVGRPGAIPRLLGLSLGSDPLLGAMQQRRVYVSQEDGTMTRADLMNRLSAAASQLRANAHFSSDKPDETPESTSQALWLAAAGQPRAASRSGTALPELTPAQADQFELLLGRRLAGEPLAYLIGRQEFMGNEFYTAPGALIPRRETELLGHAALELARERATAAGDVKILDLCTGSGNIAVALAIGEPRARICGTDLEADALALAARNVELHGVSDRVTLRQGDLFAALDGHDDAPVGFDIIVCNPPYIPSHKAKAMPIEVGGFEPPAAFDGGDFGLSILFRLVAEGPSHLAPGGWLCFELGAAQGSLLERRLSGRKAFSEIRAVRDQEGAVRVLAARRGAAGSGQ